MSFLNNNGRDQKTNVWSPFTGFSGIVDSFTNYMDILNYALKLKSTGAEKDT